MKRRSSDGTPPRAIFCAGDLLAYGAIKRLQELELAVPDDVAVERVAAGARPLGRLAGEVVEERLLGDPRTDTELILVDVARGRQVVADRARREGPEPILGDDRVVERTYLAGRYSAARASAAMRTSTYLRASLIDIFCGAAASAEAAISSDANNQSTTNDRNGSFSRRSSGIFTGDFLQQFCSRYFRKRNLVVHCFYL